MNTYIVLLRGINVSGQKKVPMAELRSILESQGLESVETYIQTGNVIFKSSIDIKKLEDLIFNTIAKYFGFEVPVLIKPINELQTIFKGCPFSKEKTERSYFTLLKTAPEKQLITELLALKIPDEDIIVTNKCVYFYSNNSYGKAKCNTNFIEKRLKINATTRNFKTMVKLINWELKN